MDYSIEHRTYDPIGTGFYVVDQDGDAHGPFASYDDAVDFLQIECGVV